MSNMATNGDQYGELIEAYALGALDPQERASLEAHLASGCPECSKALDEARWLVSQLAYLAPDAKPSELLRGRLFQTVRAEARSAGLAKSSSTIPFWMWGAVAALLLFTVYQAWETSRIRVTIDATKKSAEEEIAKRHELEEKFAIAQREAIILTDPHSVKIPLGTENKEMPKMEAVWHAKFGIVVSGLNVPAPSGTRTLQLWLIPKAKDGKPIPSLTLRPDANGNFVLLVANPPDAMDGTKALAITEEPAGGSQAPTTKPIWVGAIS
ncbi:MAG: anti-sigma factor [Acidobacteria bacterium]|nr:anti-sigma factor [Acidobacteriota bacterium]MBS1866677.1 anti-sigma factor [Acidobacteriota bacterium]